jgi:hypothetical protein
MFVPVDTDGPRREDREQRDEAERGGIAAALAGSEQDSISVPVATQGRRTTFNVLAARPEFPVGLKRSPKRFWGHIEVLRRIRWIAEVGYRHTNRHPAAKFVLTPEGRAQCVHIRK